MTTFPGSPACSSTRHSVGGRQGPGRSRAADRAVGVWRDWEMSKVASQTQGPTKANSLQAPGILQRKCACGNKTIAGGECDACGKERSSLQRRAVDNRSERSEVPPIAHDVLRSPGQPLDASTRAFMEPRFGHDFSAIRVHTDTRAALSAAAVGAHAYSVGREVVMGSGAYQPASGDGRLLLAHEL